MSDCKPISILMEVNKKFCMHESKDLCKPNNVPLVVRLFGLPYLNKTRYLIFCWSRKSLHAESEEASSRSNLENFNLSKTNNGYALLYKKGEDCKLEGFCNAC